MLPIHGRWLGDEYARLLDGNTHVGPIERHYEIADLRDKIELGPGDDRPVVLIPGGASNVLRTDTLRRWPLPHYVTLARMLIEAGNRVVLAGGPTDATVVPAFDGVGVESAIGKCSLVETLSLLRNAAVVVSHDTGPMHLARLVRTPLVALFGPTNPTEFVVPDDTVTVLWGGQFLACRPCYDGREFAHCSSNVCLSSVSPQIVFEEVMKRLASLHVRRA
jgi:heptosyltransferase-2